VQGPRERKHDAVGNLVRRHRVEAIVHLVCGRLVALEPHDGELRLDEPGIDRRDPDRPPEQVLAERVGEPPDRELGGDVRGAARVRLPAGDRPHEDDVPLVTDVRQNEARHAQHPIHVRVHDPLLVGRGRLRERRPSECEARVVEEDVDPAELRDSGLDERGRHGLVGDVERQHDVGLDPLHPPRPGRNTSTRLAQLADGCRADAG
jgi:hypothetical protein